MTHATPALVSAVTLAASYEAARRIRNGEEISDVARYVRVRAERLSRDHARLWATLPDPDPIDFARSLEPGLASTIAPTPTTTRDTDGRLHRFLSGSGAVPDYEQTPGPTAEERARVLAGVREARAVGSLRGLRNTENEQ